MSRDRNKVWQPTACLNMLTKRAEFLQRIRSFFAERNIMEVDTPLLCEGVATDPGLSAFAVLTESQKYRYLQTSPEFAMKRLIAFGCGPIYYLGKAFRKDELGSKHNPEFTMLEWYRPGWDHFQLIQEVDDLFQCLLGCRSATLSTYQALFERRYGISPHLVTIGELKKIAMAEGWRVDANLDKDGWLDLLFVEGIEPMLGQTAPDVILDYPASQAGLAKIRKVKDKEITIDVAERFEFYYQGVELANGYHELTCEKEQRMRFEKDLEKRRQQGISELPIDEKLLQALTSGFPTCAGVALGVDRLLMLKTNQSEIANVLPFSWKHA